MPSAWRDITASRNYWLSLARAVTEARETERIVADVGAEPGRLWWSSLLPILSTPHGSLIAVDCAEPHAPTSTVYYLEWEGGIWPKARSLGQMVGWWIEAVDIGAYDFDRAEGRWISDWDRLTTDQKASQLV